MKQDDIQILFFMTGETYREDYFDLDKGWVELQAKPRFMCFVKTPDGDVDIEITIEEMINFIRRNRR